MRNDVGYRPEKTDVFLVFPGDALDDKAGTPVMTALRPHDLNRHNKNHSASGQPAARQVAA